MQQACKIIEDRIFQLQALLEEQTEAKHRYALSAAIFELILVYKQIAQLKAPINDDPGGWKAEAMREELEALRRSQDNGWH